MQAKRLVQDWQAVHDKINIFPWAKQIADNLRAETDWWVAHYEDDPARIAGWGHHYFCSVCYSPLVFDPAKPDEHRCSQCGALRLDDDVTEAWCASYRSGASKQIFHAAVLYNLYGESAYMAFIRKVLAFYSDHLRSFKVRTPEGFEGIFSGINLSDAVSICWMLNGMELVKEQFSEAELRLYKDRFFIPMADFLHRKKGGTPNICCWMKSALGMIGLFFDEREWCRLAAEGEEGIKPKLLDGLLPQGFWYESSFHYHFYCVEGLTYYVAFCELYDYDFSEFTESLRKMYRYPLQFAFPNGLFPSPNDGWPLFGFANYAHQYEWIRNVYDEAPFRYALAQCYDEDDVAGSNKGENDLKIGGLSRLLFGTDWHRELIAYEREHNVSIRPARVSRYDTDIHYIMLQNEQTSVFLKYGFVIREHSHADVMNFELFFKDELLSRDISNSGYGSDLFREWQRKSIAHNTVMVDQLNQPNRSAGQLVAFDAAGNGCRVKAEDVYPGITYMRSLQLLPDRLLDEFTVTVADRTDEEPVHTIDWFFHCSGEPTCELPMASAQSPGDADGYQLMQDVRSCTTDEHWEVSWTFHDKRLTLAMAGSPGTTVYLFRGYEHRSDLLRWGVMVRRTGRGALFKAEYRLAGYDRPAD